jgi:hypothetical protein
MMVLLPAWFWEKKEIQRCESMLIDRLPFPSTYERAGLRSGCNNQNQCWWIFEFTILESATSPHVAVQPA